MNSSTFQEAVKEYSGEACWTGLSHWLLLAVISCLASFTASYKSLCAGLLGLTSGLLRPERGSGGPAPGSARIDIHGRLVLARDAGLLNLVVVNRSRIGIWAEDAKIVLTDLDTGSASFTPTRRAILKMGEFVPPRETLDISLVEAIYNAAGRPQDEYSFLISTVLQYRASEDDKEQLEAPVPSYWAWMSALDPIRLRRRRWYEKPTRTNQRVPEFCGLHRLPPDGKPTLTQVSTTHGLHREDHAH
jgi:hypothetical protein